MRKHTFSYIILIVNIINFASMLDEGIDPIPMAEPIPTNQEHKIVPDSVQPHPAKLQHQIRVQDNIDVKAQENQVKEKIVGDNQGVEGKKELKIEQGKKNQNVNVEQLQQKQQEQRKKQQERKKQEQRKKQEEIKKQTEAVEAQMRERAEQQRKKAQDNNRAKRAQEQEQARIKAEMQRQKKQQQSRKYKQQQQRIKQIRRRQQEERRQRQQVSYQLDAEVDNENEMKKTELTNVKNNYQKMIKEGSSMKTAYSGFLFESVSPIEEFTFHFVADQMFYLKMVIYMAYDGAYTYIKDTDEAMPYKFYIYEDNNRIVAQATFYYQYFTYFKCKKGSTYTIRFYNEDNVRRLISIGHPKILSSQLFDNLIKSEHGQKNLQKGKMIMNKIDEIISQLQLTSAIDFINSSVVQASNKKFVLFQYAQMVLVIAVSVLQIQMIKKMFKTQSIL